MPVDLYVGMGGDDVSFIYRVDFGNDFFVRHVLVEADAIAAGHSVRDADRLGAGELKSQLIGQSGEEVGLLGAYSFDKPVEATPAFGVVGAMGGAFCAEVEQVELVIATYDGPVGGADDVNDVVVEGHRVDQVAVEDNEIGLEPCQFSQDGLQRGQISVDVGENGESHGRWACSQVPVCGTLPAMLPGGWRTVKLGLQ